MKYGWLINGCTTGHAPMKVNQQLVEKGFVSNKVAFPVVVRFEFGFKLGATILSNFFYRIVDYAAHGGRNYFVRIILATNISFLLPS